MGRARRPAGHARGFTLVEALVVLVVAGALVRVAVPSFSAFTASMRLTSAANDLLADLHLTRAEAMKRRRRVVICKSADGLACADAGGWHQGWIVFVDSDADGWRQPSEPVLQRQTALGAPLRLEGNGTVNRYVAYAPDGATRLVGGGFQAGTLTVCREGEAGAPARQIVISAGGRPRVQKLVLPACG
jgi:type IV fimbrial biogenesis protein FimT